MGSIWTHPLTLRGLNALAMGKAFLKYRNPRRQASGKYQTEFYEKTWREAAIELGGTWTKLSDDISEMVFDGFRTRVTHNVSCIDDPVTLSILHNKPLTHQLLMAENIPVPRHATFSPRKMSPAIEFMKSSGRDCVVKPAGGTGGGRGVTTGIQTTTHLAKATALAAVYSDELLIEEQIDGDNYRLLYLDGELLDSFIRRLPTVIGDGKSSVSKLVELANEERLKNRADISQVLLSIDLDMHRTLAKQGLSLRAVPAAGKKVILKTVVNENSGADNTTATSMLCPSIIEDGAKAARTLGVRFVGIDIVTRDPGIPLAESGGVILEANGTPNLYYHYKKKDGAFPVAVHLLKRIISTARGKDAMESSLSTSAH